MTIPGILKVKQHLWRKTKHSMTLNAFLHDRCWRVFGERLALWTCGNMSECTWKFSMRLSTGLSDRSKWHFLHWFWWMWGWPHVSVRLCQSLGRLSVRMSCGFYCPFLLEPMCWWVRELTRNGHWFVFMNSRGVIFVPLCNLNTWMWFISQCILKMWSLCSTV